MASLVALGLLVAAVTAGSDSLAKCVPQPDKLYTPDKTQIDAQIQKLEVFDSDMRAVLRDMKTLQSDDIDNTFWGEVAVGRTIAGEVGRGICSGINMVNSKLAKPCKATQDVVDLINDMEACGEGKTTGCIGAGLAVTKTLIKRNQKKLDRGVEGLGGSEAGATSDPRYLWNQGLQKEKGNANINEAIGLGAEKAKTLNEKAKGGIDALTEWCKVVGKSDVCDLMGNAGKVAEAYKAGEELDASYKENATRRAKLIQQLEAKMSAVSLKINQLHIQVDEIVDWNAMGKPEPNMTPIKQEGCDDALDRLAKDGLGEMDRVRQAAPVREPDQSGSEMDGLAILGEVLGNATALHQQFKQQQELYSSQRISPPLQGNTRDRSNDCAARMTRAGRSAFECNVIAPDPPSLGPSYGQSSQSRSPSPNEQFGQKRPPPSGGCEPCFMQCPGKQCKGSR